MESAESKEILENQKLKSLAIQLKKSLNDYKNKCVALEKQLYYQSNEAKSNTDYQNNSLIINDMLHDVRDPKKENLFLNESEIENYKQKLIVKNEEIISLKENNILLNKEKKHNIEESQKLSKQIDKLKLENEFLNGQVIRLHIQFGQVEDNQEMIRVKDLEIESYEKCINNLKESMGDKDVETLALKKQLETLEDVITNNEQDICRLKSLEDEKENRIQELNEKIALLDIRIEDFTEKENETMTRHQNLLEEIDRVRLSAQNETSFKETLFGHKLADLQRELGRCKAEHNSYKIARCQDQNAEKFDQCQKRLQSYLSRDRILDDSNVDVNANYNKSSPVYQGANSGSRRDTNLDDSFNSNEQPFNGLNEFVRNDDAIFSITPHSPHPSYHDTLSKVTHITSSRGDQYNNVIPQSVSTLERLLLPTHLSSTLSKSATKIPKTGSESRETHLTRLLAENEWHSSRLTEQIELLKREIRRLDNACVGRHLPFRREADLLEDFLEGKSVENVNTTFKEPLQNLEYLKNVLVKFLSPETDGQQRKTLVSVLSTILQLRTDQKLILNRVSENNILFNLPSDSLFNNEYSSAKRFGFF
ncbi:GRIP and coiled-coil domain-containing protein 2-like isoform X2 [Gordionus sp. m RMFG-2023]|uniref:GRIP and coiled-coil domain-containing protein 2-like isoform X2 n=1 Tax=Gordionus sp. m RMFG-2023 TaxID=3053472 RepID=UPI0031FDA5E8